MKFSFVVLAAAAAWALTSHAKKQPSAPEVIPDQNVPPQRNTTAVAPSGTQAPAK